MAELEKLKGNLGSSFLDSGVPGEGDQADNRVKRFPQFSHFASEQSSPGYVASPYHGAVHSPPPYHTPEPAYHQPEPYAPAAPAYHEPAPYAPPAPVYHEPAPVQAYHEPAPYSPAPPAYHEPAPYHPPAPAYHPPAPHHKPEPYHAEEHNEHGAPGLACVDYPCHAVPPYTKFSCANVPFTPGMYADPESGCQAYRVCNDGRDGPHGAGFLCPNGTLFDQYQFACEYWNKVDCSKAPSLYSLNADPAHNPYYPKPKLDEYGNPLPDPHHVVHHAAAP